MINKEVTNKYTNYVISEMVKKYDISNEEAINLLDVYNFQSLMEEFPSETLHYSINYWVDEIYNSKVAQLV